MRVKHIIYSVLGLSLCGAMFAGCTLDQFPHNAVSSKNLTEEDSELLLTGLYYIVQNKPTNNGYASFDICGGDLIRGGGSSTGSAQQMIRDLVTPDSGFVSGQWNGYYTGLYQINEFLVSVNAMAETTRRNEMIGIASFFRGLFYYNLVSRWGEVPILDTPTLNDVPAASEAEGWAFVEKELETAIKWAPDFTSRYYVSRQAAQALMARVKLVQGKNAEARALAEEVIGSGYFALDDFSRIFRNRESNSEEIFTFSNLKEESSISLSGSFYFSRASDNGGSYTYAPTPEVMNMYEIIDNRRDISIDQQGTNDVINKYPSGEVDRDPLPIVRLSEMYLISAEASGPANGMRRLNELREKRGLLPHSATTDDSAFITMILAERRLEFLAENQRWLDLVRTNRLESTLGLEHKYNRFPIPTREMDLNKSLKQNSYWRGESVE